MKLLVDKDSQPYKSRGGFRAGVCKLLVYFDAASSSAVAIVTERPDNPGPSVTAAAEEIAERVTREQGLDPARVIWVERYVERAKGGTLREKMSTVEFTWRRDALSGWVAYDPRWEITDRIAVQALVSQAIPPAHPDEAKSP